MRRLIAIPLVLAAAGCGSTTTTVTRSAPAAAVTPRTVTEIVKTVTTRVPATTAPTSPPVAASGTTTVPGNLVNKTLPADESELDTDAIGYKTVGGGVFGILVKSDWGVCATTPTAGQPVHGPVKLIVGHFTCGA